MNLSVIFHGDWEVYAHRDPVSGKRELLQEHIARCEKYRIRISQERKLLKIEENFLTKLGLDKDDFAGKLVKEMIDAVIIFHDLGKETPAFQKNKMGNQNTIPTKYWGDDSSHSFLSAFLYLDFYLYEIKNGFNKVEKEQKKALIALAWELSYVIAKHHSNFESMEAYLKNFQLKAEELLRKWKEEPVPGFSQLRYFYEIPIAKSINQYFMCRKAFGRTENDIVHYFFIRLEYSILVACDYYATTEFNSGFEMDCFGKADASKFREIYERSHLMESIRKYGKESYPRKKWDGREKINILRNELFLEAEENLKAAEEDSIYFVEAPTGSGKSNLALNLSLKFLEHADKLFEIYPFNTLAEQNRHTLETIFGKTEAINDIAVVNSLTPIRGRGNVEEDPEKYYKEALLDRQFLNYPFILSSHVTFFRTLFGTGKEDIMSFFQLLNSVVVLDEIQSYRNAIWTEIMILLNSCAGLMNMKIIIMSATLPDLSQLVDGKCNVVKLIRNPEKYTLHPTFANRVICNYELLQEEITLDRLRRHVLENMQLREKCGAKILITFIKKQTAYDFFHRMKEALGEQSEWQLKLLTGDDSIYERESILKPIRENVWKKVILISTQIVEAGVDIDMDIGYKDISKLDSEEQFLGRIARSGIKNGIPGIVYFFNLDQAEKIYRDDYRMEKSLTLGNEEMRTVLKEKRFQTYYEQVMHYLKEMKNRKTSEEGLEYFFSESLKKLDFLKIQKRMELIEEDCWHVDIILCRKLVMEDGTEKDGRKIWEHYKELLSDYQMDYSEKKVKLSECQSDLNLFRYQIKRNIQIPYNEMIGELYCVYDGEQYFQDEKIDREKLEGDHMYFIDL